MSKIADRPRPARKRRALFARAQALAKAYIPGRGPWEGRPGTRSFAVLYGRRWLQSPRRACRHRWRASGKSRPAGFPPSGTNRGQSRPASKMLFIGFPPEKMRYPVWLGMPTRTLRMGRSFACKLPRAWNGFIPAESRRALSRRAGPLRSPAGNSCVLPNRRRQTGSSGSKRPEPTVERCV